MDTLQSMFDSRLNVAIDAIKAKLLKRKFEEAGIRIKDCQVQEVLNQLGHHKISIELDESQFKKGISTSRIDLNITDDEVSEIIRKARPALENTVPKLVEDSARLMLRNQKKALSFVPGMQRDRKGFESRLYNRWKKPLDLYDFYLVVTSDAGDRFNQHYRSDAAKQKDFVFDVLIRLHARACQVGWEVRALLHGGFADGAHARWRTLHEITCVAIFVKSHGVEVAERYKLHDHVDAFKSARQYQQWCKVLGQKSIPKRKMEILQRNYDLVKDKFGSPFVTQYGWAAAAIGKPKPTFADLERHVGLEKLRPYYKMASDNVHAGVRGIVVKLGVPSGTEMLLAGPSDSGLADPGHGTALSLFQLTVTVMTHKPNIDSLVVCAVVNKLQDRIGAEFLRTNERMRKLSDKRRQVRAKSKIRRKSQVEVFREGLKQQ